MFSGPFGLKTTPKSSIDTQWAKKILGIEFFKKPHPENFLLSSDQTPWWNIPPGLLIAWKSNQYKHYYSYSEDFTDNRIFPVDSKMNFYNFKNKTASTAVIKKINGNRMTYLGLLPNFKNHNKQLY